MKTYPSKIDWWFAGLMVSVPVILLIVGVAVIGANIIASLVCIISGLYMGSIMFLLGYPCSYIITDKNLIIRSGVFNEESIPLSQVRDAKLSSNPLSAPALSLKRVKISLKDGYRLISPINREEFIAELLSRAPGATGSANA